MSSLLSQKWTSAEDVIKKLDISRSTLKRWIKENKLPKPLLIGNTMRFNLEEFDNFLLSKPENAELRESRDIRKAAERALSE